MKTKSIIMAAAAAIGVIGIAMATPIVKLASPFLAVGTHPHGIWVTGKGHTSTGAPFAAELASHGPATLSIQDAAFAAGGHNGWHSHPGLVAVTIISGSLRWYDENCNAIEYTAGDSWMEGDKLHYFTNTTANGGTLHLMAWFITAEGTPVRTDEPAPPCAAGLGLN